jgi:hypothetical protein
MRWFRLSAITLILILLTGGAAAAENLGPGGGSRLIVGDEVVGAYRLLATSSPNPATTGTVTYVVRVSDPQTGAKILDADVEIELSQPETGAVIKMAATHQNAGNNIDYAAHVPVDQTGSWNGVLRVKGALGSSEVKFLQNISPPRSFGTVVLIGVPFVVVLGVLGVMFFMRSSRKPASSTK